MRSSESCDDMAIHGYHHAPNSSWRQTTDLDGNFVGLELETHNNRGRDATDRAIENSGINYKGVMPVCEADGSISHTEGTEVVCPPVSLANALKAGGFVDKIVDVLRGAGATEDPARNYGMHMNINVRNWTAQERYLHMFVLRCLRTIAVDLGKRVGEQSASGREDGYWSPWNNLEVDYPAGFRYDNASKYNPSWIRRNNVVMEVRYPKAVLTFNHIRTNISFIYSIRSFLNTEAGRWATFFAAKAGIATQKREECKEVVKQVYLSWLKNQRNFRNLFNAININPENQRAFTLESAKEYCKNALYPTNATLQEQTVEWSDRAATRHAVTADS